MYLSHRAQEDAATIAASLANRGTNPRTGVEVIPHDVSDQIINVMMSCGMYNGAGKWIVDVGVPAKSGVSGVIMGVVPVVCGFAVLSPKLDEHGNSTRGVMVAKELSDALGLHVLKTAPSSSTPAKKGSGSGYSLKESSFREPKSNGSSTTATVTMDRVTVIND